MYKALVLLDSVDKVKDFVCISSKFEAELDLVNGRYVIDAKSIMGILTIDLSKPMILQIHDGRESIESILGALREYIVA